MRIEASISVKDYVLDVIFRCHKLAFDTAANYGLLKKSPALASSSFRVFLRKAVKQNQVIGYAVPAVPGDSA